MEKFTFIDLFSGLGGFRIAAENNGGRCVFSSEIDKFAQLAYEENFNETPQGDIKKIDASDIPDHDFLFAGFPCQPFSIAGNRLGFNDTRGTLFFDVARIIKTKRPTFILLENVAGIVNHDKGKTLDTITNVLSELNYEFSWKLMNAKKYGIPQNRNRWYLIGYDKDKSIDINFNEIYPKEKELEFTLEQIIDRNATSDYSISPIAESNIEKHIDKFVDSKRYESEYPIIANNIRPSKVSFSSNGISPCLTAKMGTGGNNIPVIYDQKRKLTVNECLRIMGFPKNYRLKENYSQSYKQIGNSVVVPLLDQLIKNTIKCSFD